MRKFTRRTSIVAAGVAAATTAGIAFAAWTSTGSGFGTATSEAISDVTFTAGTTTSKVYPLASSDIVVEVTNPNHYNAALSAWSMPAVFDAADLNLGNYGVPGEDQPTDLSLTCDLTLAPPVGVVVEGDATSAELTIAGGLNMGNGAANSCADLTFAVALSATATSTGATPTIP